MLAVANRPQLSRRASAVRASAEMPANVASARSWIAAHNKRSGSKATSASSGTATTSETQVATNVQSARAWIAAYNARTSKLAHNGASKWRNMPAEAVRDAAPAAVANPKSSGKTRSPYEPFKIFPDGTMLFTAEQLKAVTK